MTWLRIDDHYATHPKLNAAGPLALAVDMAGMCYASLNLSDGHVPRSALPILLNMPIAQIHKQIVKLIEVGRWETAEDGYLIHDFLDYNLPSEEIKERRQKDAGRKSVRRSSTQNPSGQNVDSERNPSGIRVPRTPAPSPAPKDQEKMNVLSKGEDVSLGTTEHQNKSHRTTDQEDEVDGNEGRTTGITGDHPQENPSEIHADARRVNAKEQLREQRRADRRV